jgi:protocatechuate 3,4-dioxygenase beta subunit
MNEQLELTRRRLLELGLAVPLPILIAACGGGDDSGDATRTTTAATTVEKTTTLSPTPTCDDGDEPTPDQTEGPFFRPDSPERRRFLDIDIGVPPLLLTGSVLATDCTPIAGALLDFWHAGVNGEYDNDGYRFRGHQFADRQGRYRLETALPGLYTGRTRHIHVKVQARRGPVLTTQLYFPGEPRNESDSIFDPALLMEVRGSGRFRTARFDFVLASSPA